MPAYALHTDMPAFGMPARYRIHRYSSEAVRNRAVAAFDDGRAVAARILAEGRIVPACIPTPYETLEPVSEWAAARIAYAAASVYKPYMHEWAEVDGWYRGDPYVSAVLYLY